MEEVKPGKKLERTKSDLVWYNQGELEGGMNVEGWREF